ncbi:MAG: hypothetical protein WA364_26210 [Candidatus Nitrosopolaris sp.]
MKFHFRVRLIPVKVNNEEGRINLSGAVLLLLLGIGFITARPGGPGNALKYVSV